MYVLNLKEELTLIYLKYLIKELELCILLSYISFTLSKDIDIYLQIRNQQLQEYFQQFQFSYFIDP